MKHKAGTASTAKSVMALLQNESLGFSNAEMHVVRQLLANYPAAGLTTISKLAQLSGVSDPTVLRVATRLGFSGFTDFQNALLTEVEAHMRSPLTLIADRARSGPHGIYQDFLEATLRQAESMRTTTAVADYARATAMMCAPKSRIAFLGGRFSGFVAGLMQKSFNTIRADSYLVNGSAAHVFDDLAEFGSRHLLVVFDYRRYQRDVISFARQAKSRGADVLLFTDVWRSPIAAFADLTLQSPTDTASPFDTFVTPLLQVEAVIAGCAARLEPEFRERASQFESIREENSITLGAQRPRKGKPPT